MVSNINCYAVGACLKHCWKSRKCWELALSPFSTKACYIIEPLRCITEKAFESILGE